MTTRMISYEVVWCEKSKMYIWSYQHKEEVTHFRNMPNPVSSPLDLPDPVLDVYNFVRKQKQQIPVMVYMLNQDSICVYCNAKEKVKTFSNAVEWLKDHGYPSNRTL